MSKEREKSILEILLKRKSVTVKELAKEAKQKPGEMELKIAQTAASFLGRQMES